MHCPKDVAFECYFGSFILCKEGLRNEPAVEWRKVILTEELNRKMADSIITRCEEGRYADQLGYDITENSSTERDKKGHHTQKPLTHLGLIMMYLTTVLSKYFPHACVFPTEKRVQPAVTQRRKVRRKNSDPCKMWNKKRNWKSGRKDCFTSKNAFCCLSTLIENLLIQLPKVSIRMVINKIPFHSSFLISKTEQLSHKKKQLKTTSGCLDFRVVCFAFYVSFVFSNGCVDTSACVLYT